MSGAAPLVSVITANYNGARHLAAAVRSVLGQTLTSLELIVADDASSDDSLAVIACAAAGDPRVRVLKAGRNGGPGAARNRALKAARGRYIAVFDSDDLMAPDRLEKLVARARVDHADIVVDNLLVFQDDGPAPWRAFLCQKAWNHPRWITLADYIEAGRMYSKQPGLGYLKPLFSAEILKGERYREDLRIGEDYDLVLRLLAKGARMRFLPDPLYRYRKHGASISHVMRREHIEQMLAADAALEAQMRQQGDQVRRAQARRRRSLETALVYDRVICALKAKDVGGALGACATDPAVWPLLAMPVAARLKRLTARAHA
ncbi:glycosyltransferase [Phenylobacterium sp.]|uniref:glycosyltransferase family 2 protein n=1 Tax=Phenylobacterium sp. TaxID=1871053 RepID=UPI002810B31B|nr:glycosyltransferase [Phenylobacterium sp.]